ncbi:hypothetical protein HKBW3S03_01661, partial [Candidatus Hakubella thermalkaliphila]
RAFSAEEYGQPYKEVKKRLRNDTATIPGTWSKIGSRVNTNFL